MGSKFGWHFNRFGRSEFRVGLSRQGPCESSDAFFFWLFEEYSGPLESDGRMATSLQCLGQTPLAKPEDGFSMEFL